MKRSTLQQHKEATMLCEGMTIAKTRSALSIPHNIKQAILTKIKNNTWKIDIHCIIYGMTNHNVKICQKRKKKTMAATTEVTQPSQKTQKTSSYARHICGLNGHKVINCPKLLKSKKCFMGNL
jgi:hypothetical protein